MYIEFSAHNAFLVLTAPGMLIIKRLEKQIILKFLRAGKQAQSFIARNRCENDT
jgi:hypothetical protein